MYETIKAFAVRTGFTYSAIRLMCLRGQLPFVQIGNRRMIPIERALQALAQLEEREGER